MNCYNERLHPNVVEGQKMKLLLKKSLTYGGTTYIEKYLISYYTRNTGKEH